LRPAAQRLVPPTICRRSARRRIDIVARELHPRIEKKPAPAGPARRHHRRMSKVAKIPPGVGPRHPQVVVLFGATGDLARRKLLPGLFHLASAGFIPGCRIIGVSLDEFGADEFRQAARSALDEFSARPVTPADWAAFSASLDYLPLSAGAEALRAAVARAEEALTGSGAQVTECRRLHYLSVPPSAALSAVRLLGEAGLVERSRIVMEKPFGTDKESAVSLNAELHEVFAEEQIFRIDHFLGKEPAQNILAFRFANGLFEPIWNRNFIDHVQIDVPETLGLGKRSGFYEQTGAYRDMVVTHLFQILGFMAMEPPTSLEPAPISEEKNKVFRSMLPIQPTDVVRGQYSGYRSEEGVDPESETETFIALKCFIDNWRWAGVPFFLRTGKRLAEGQRIISIAFREPPKSMFPAGSGVGAQGPDHLTFDLADASKMSLSFYGKRPGPGMRLDKLSLQFAMHDTGLIGDVLEAYERLILDAMRGDRTLFTTAEGIERLWEVSIPLLENPPPVRLYPPGSWGPKSVHQLIAPHAWRLPFERAWRDPNKSGG
jgi:glucose-6-phosphate 1-dehydrogenase